MGKKQKKRKPGGKPSRNTHFRELDSVRFNERDLPPEFTSFVKNEIWPLLNTLHRGYKINEKLKITMQIVHNLIETGLTNKVVADSRNYNEKEARKRIPIWDALAEKKLCAVCKGSEITRKVTRYRAEGRLLELKEIWKLKLLEDLVLKRNTEDIKPTSHALVVLYRGKTDWLTGRTLPDNHKIQSILKYVEAVCDRDKMDLRKPDPRAVQNGLNYFREIENIINAINTENLAHSWIGYTGNAIAFQPNVCLRQIHSGALFRGTRLYSWGAMSGQALSKEQRQTIKIDDEPAAEIDSHCHAIRLAYHLSGIDKKGDVYWPKQILPRFWSHGDVLPTRKEMARNFVKKCTNICLNTSSRCSAVRAISKTLRDSKNHEFLKYLVFKTEDTNLLGILDRIVKVHPPKVSASFFANYGMELMRIDGSIMLHTLIEFVVKRQRPALAIHDSLVVKISDVTVAKRVFRETYHKFTEFYPVIKRKF